LEEKHPGNPNLRVTEFSNWENCSCMAWAQGRLDENRKQLRFKTLIQIYQWSSCHDHCWL